MFCPECGKEIPDASRFCLSCGHSLERITTLSLRQDESAVASQSRDTAKASNLQLPDNSGAKDNDSSGLEKASANSARPNRSQPSKTVTTIDDSIQVIPDRDLKSDAIASIPNRTEVELGGTSTVDGREWIKATLKNGEMMFRSNNRGETEMMKKKKSYDYYNSNETSRR